MDKTLYSIFKKGSKTYFYSTVFFPPAVKKDVFALYGFVREADNFVDAVPQRVEEFHSFCDLYYQTNQSGDPSGNIVIDSFVELKQRKRFDSKWIEAFLKSMEMDLHKSRYANVAEVEEYIYGSAEVVGLMMAQILDLAPESHHHARHLGKAMQYINFIRDISEDLSFGRTYMPQEELARFGLPSLEEEVVVSKTDAFRQFISAQLDRYREWQSVAEEGYRYIPKRYLIPIKTAAEMYKWTGEQIRKNPLVVFDRKVKPSIPRIFAKAGYHAATL